MSYAPWVKRHGLKHPYGYCQCGCGQKTNLARQSDTKLGYAKDEPMMYLRNHHRTAASLADAFWGNVSKTDNDKCWEWQGSKTIYGYGRIKRRRKVYMAHKVSYELHHGRIPEGLVICHKCDNRGCVNPSHLFLGTHADNSTDMVEKDRQAKGEDVGNSKLSESDVIAIRELAKQGKPYKEISKQFGVYPTTVGRIARRESWTHLT